MYKSSSWISMHVGEVGLRYYVYSNPRVVMSARRWWKSNKGGILPTICKTYDSPMARIGLLALDIFFAIWSCSMTLQRAFSLWVWLALLNFSSPNCYTKPTNLILLLVLLLLNKSFENFAKFERDGEKRKSCSKFTRQVHMIKQWVYHYFSIYMLMQQYVHILTRQCIRA